MEPTNQLPALNGKTKGAAVEKASFDALEGKLNVAITKVEVLVNGQESLFTKVDELLTGQAELKTGLKDLKKGQSLIVNGQKDLLRDLTDAVHQLKVAVTDRPLSKSSRLLVSFTGGLAGGIAGGAIMTLILEIALSLGNPQALALANAFHLRRRFPQGVEELVQAVGHHPTAFDFNGLVENGRGDLNLHLGRVPFLLPFQRRDPFPGLVNNQLDVLVPLDVQLDDHVSSSFKTKAGPRAEGFQPFFLAS